MLDGGLGVDTVSYADAKDVVIVDLASNVAFSVDTGFDTLTGIEHVIGGFA